MMTETSKKPTLGLKAKKRIGIISTYVVLTILSIIWIIPILWIILHSFREEYNASGDFVGIVVSHYFPKSYGVENYRLLFTASYYGVQNAFIKWWTNTLIVAVFCCLISTFLVLSVGYCMSKLRFKMRKPFMNLSMVLGLFPGFMSMVAIYYLLKAIGLTQNLFGLILIRLYF